MYINLIIKSDTEPQAVHHVQDKITRNVPPGMATIMSVETENAYNVIVRINFVSSWWGPLVRLLNDWFCEDMHKVIFGQGSLLYWGCPDMTEECSVDFTDRCKA